MSTIQADSGKERYRAVGLVTFPAGPGEELVFAEHSRAKKLIPGTGMDLLASCDRFRTLDEHARAICAGAGLPPDQITLVREQIGRYASEGLLVSERSILDRCLSSGQRSDPNPPISTLAVVTRDRPESLDRCLSGYVLNAKDHARTPRFLVLDDSRSPGSREDLLRRLAALKVRTGADLAYAGPEEKRRYRDELARESGVDPALLDFALLDPERTGHTPGANRNAFLLESAGEKALCVDDDTVCQVAAVPDAPAPALALSSEHDPTEVWHFSDHASALGSSPFVPRDFIGLHEEFLGKPVGQCVREAAARGPVDLDTLDARFLRLLRGGAATVRLSQIGLIGDCAQGTSHWIITHHGRSRTRLLDSADAYRTATRSREVIRGARQTTICSRSGFMTYGAGYDHRDLLVPFLPVMRGQDGLFVQTLQKCLEEDAFVAHLPWLLHHDPMDRREFEPDGFWLAASATYLLDFVGISLGSYQHGPAKPSGPERLRALGTHLSELGALQAPEFEELFSRLFWQRNTYWIEELEREAARLQGTSAHWAENLRKAAGQLRAGLVEEELCLPRDLQRGREPEESKALGRRILQRFGDLLRAWPEITCAAQRLRRGGRSLARPV
jgi:hypothetical protein